MSRFSVIAIVGVIGVMVVTLFYALTTESSQAGRQVWDPAHGHYHTVP